MSLPHVTEHVQWGEHLVFKVAGKMFCVLALEPDVHVLSLKVSDENFIQLQETEGIVPAPYLARAKWLALERFDVLRDAEFRELLTEAHRLVFEKLPRKTREQLTSPKTITSSKASNKAASKKKSAPKKKARAARSRS